MSSNHLLRIIPPSLTSLSFLSYFNLSNNNLSNGVLTGTKLQGFNASSFVGNQDFCGLPLLKGVREMKQLKVLKLVPRMEKEILKSMQTDMKIYGFIQALQLNLLLDFGEFVDH